MPLQEATLRLPNLAPPLLPDLAFPIALPDELAGASLHQVCLSGTDPHYAVHTMIDVRRRSTCYDISVTFAPDARPPPLPVPHDYVLSRLSDLSIALYFGFGLDYRLTRSSNPIRQASVLLSPHGPWSLRTSHVDDEATEAITSVRREDYGQRLSDRAPALLGLLQGHSDVTARLVYRPSLPQGASRSYSGVGT